MKTRRDRIEDGIMFLISLAAKGFFLCMSILFAAGTVWAFCSIFTNAGALGVFGTAASGLITWAMWGICKDLKIYDRH